MMSEKTIQDLARQWAAKAQYFPRMTHIAGYEADELTETLDGCADHIDTIEARLAEVERERDEARAVINDLDPTA